MKNINWTQVLIAGGVAIVAGIVLTNMGLIAKIPLVGTFGMKAETKKALAL